MIITANTIAYWVMMLIIKKKKKTMTDKKKKKYKLLDFALLSVVVDWAEYVDNFLKK